MKYTIEFELPNNKTIEDELQGSYVSWSIWGYSGVAKAKPVEEPKKGKWVDIVEMDSGGYMIIEYDGFEVRYKENESDQWKTVGIDELILNYEDTRWIPVMERLPEKPKENCDYYFSAVRSKDVKADEYIVMIEGAAIPTTLYWDGTVWFNTYENDPYTYDVVAWQPLPEPYKGGDAECNQ